MVIVLGKFFIVEMSLAPFAFKKTVKKKEEGGKERERK
jgi:hypothetical protein